MPRPKRETTTAMANTTAKRATAPKETQAGKTTAAKKTGAKAKKAATATATTKKAATKGKATATKAKTTTKAPKKAPAKALVKAEVAPEFAAKVAAQAHAQAPTEASLAKSVAATTENTNSSKKRQRDDAEAEQETKKPKKAAEDKRRSKKPKLNNAPEKALDIYVFGTGESGELGLGPEARDAAKKQKPKFAKRPRLNDLLDAKTVGVVQVAVGGMHCVALTKKGEILTWGVNDNGALGRDTTWEAPVKDMDADNSDSDDEDEDGGLNPKESTPTAIPSDAFGDHPVTFVQVAATDNASFALTDEGKVFGWGTFRCSDGPIGLTTDVASAAAKTKGADASQRTPIEIPALKNIKQLAAGGNHMLALNAAGTIYTWGSGEQYQLGREVMESYRSGGLTPSTFKGVPRGKTVKVFAGSYHSFALTEDGKVYAWGLNNYGQTGIKEGAGDDQALVKKATMVDSFADRKIVQIQGGEHHSIACDADGNALVWGRCDFGQAGFKVSNLGADKVVKDQSGRAAILLEPSVVPDVEGVMCVAAGIDNCLVVTKDGEAWTWGYSENYRTGLGTDDQVDEPTAIENTAVAGKMLSFAGCGGQFSLLAGPAK